MIAARIPMITTTMRTSTSVKPDFRRTSSMAEASAWEGKMSACETNNRADQCGIRPVLHRVCRLQIPVVGHAVRGLVVPIDLESARLDLIDPTRVGRRGCRGWPCGERQHALHGARAAD